MNQLAESPFTRRSAFWLAMMRMKNSTMAGARRLRAVPPMVWSAFRLTAAKLSSSEKAAPSAAEMSIARSSRPWSVTQSPAALAASNTSNCWALRTKSTPMKAPKIMMPSRARFMMPLRSAKTPASATIMSGTA